MVVGADGIRSVVRKAVMPDMASDPLAFTNYVAYRGLVPTEKLRAAGVQTDLSRSPICWAGTDKVRQFNPLPRYTTLCDDNL